MSERLSPKQVRQTFSLTMICYSDISIKYNKMELFGQLQADIADPEAQVKPAQNTQAYTFHFFPKHYIIEANSRAVKVQKCLHIDRSSGKVTEQIKESVKGAEKSLAFSALLGTINILDRAFVVIVQDVTHVCSMEMHDVFQIYSIQFVPYDSESDVYQSPKAQQILQIIQNLKHLFLSGFYFSYSYDLTCSKIKQAIGKVREDQFIWNKNLIRQFTQTQIDSKWITPIIQGYIGYFTVYVAGKKLDFYLISRRSSRRAGTRYNSRGIDDEGNVSNFCETEQIILYDTFCCSHLQIRGSVPLFWSQRGYLTETKIARTKEMTAKAFIKHFDMLSEEYSRVICLNLMAKHKKGEQMITENYEQHIKSSNLENVRYEWFDFHNQCKNSQFHLSNPLIRKMHQHNKNFSFYLEDCKTRKVHYIQRGIFRTNCLDCLDRTNFVQTKLAMDILQCQLKVLGVDLTEVLKMPAIEAMDEEDIKIENLLVANFKTIWADNGDVLSNHYTGTGSTHTNITRTGRRDFSGILDHGKKSLLRFYMQNFEDNVKQEAIDILLGNHTETVNVFTVNIEKELKIKEKEYSEYKEITVFILTWNLGGAEMPKSYDLCSQVFDQVGQPLADIIVFGTQEMVTTSAKSVVVQNSDKLSQQWVTLILQNLNQKEKYVLIKSKDLVGIGLYIFAKDSMKDRITRVSYDTVKLGLMGTMGNKGGVVVKMYIDDSLFCFANAHFEHGAKSLNSRMMNFKDLHQFAFNVIHIGKKKEEKIEQCDYRFLFGDLNFRIQLPQNEIMQFIEKQKKHLEANKSTQAQEIQKYLLSHDELNALRKSHEAIARYKEAPITFNPTYKYEPYSSQYDSQRAPSWTDRILLWGPEGLNQQQLAYQRHEINISDHRPVSAYFKLQIKQENLQKKDLLLKQMYDHEIKEVLDDKKILEIAENEEDDALLDS